MDHIWTKISGFLPLQSRLKPRQKTEHALPSCSRCREESHTKTLYSLALLHPEPDVPKKYTARRENALKAKLGSTK